MSDSTIFGRILDGEIPCHRVYEDDRVLAFLDVGPLSRGHLLVIPKEREATLDRLSDESAAAIGRVLPRLCRAVKAASGASAFNVLQNNGSAAHQAVHHVHFHVIPRFAESGLEIGWPAGSLDSGDAEELVRAMRNALEADTSPDPGESATAAFEELPLSIWILGDLHGQLDPLERLLSEIAPDPDRDELWCVGDLVNRGPDSLGVLRWARRTAECRGDRFRTILGNHDLRLLAWAAGIGEPRPKDRVDDVLGAPDRDELVEWLRLRTGLLHRSGDLLMVHAGVLPSWSAGRAEKEARFAEGVLRSDRWRELLRAWDGVVTAPDPQIGRAARALEVLTKLRTLRRDEAACSFKGPPEQAPAGCLPWFDHPDRRTEKVRIAFGHWAALGVRVRDDYVCLDGGAAWGGAVTALHVGDDRLVQVPV